MKILKYIIKGSIRLGLAAVFTVQTGCTSMFEKWNTDPHSATNDDMDKDNLKTGSFFSQMQQYVFVANNVAGDYQIAQNLSGDIFSGYIGPCGNWAGGSNNSTYNLIADWNKAAFNFAYLNIMAPWSRIKELADQTGLAHVTALATILKVEGMHRITDIYGPVPYSNFGAGVIKARYDSQENVYNAFFTELDNAITVLTDFHTKNPGATILADYDNVYDGNVERWIKFANTLRLRLAMRIVYANAAKAQQEAESAAGHAIGVITASEEGAALKNGGKLSYENPLFIISYNFNEIRMGATMDSYLNGYNDPRVSRYFAASSAGDYRGVRTGIRVTTAYPNAAFSKLNVAINSSLIWMGPAESYFLRAEGALRGWNMGGTAQQLYEEGIRTSFAYAGATGADSYLQNATDVPRAYTDIVSGSNNSPALSSVTIKWDETAAFEVKLERIITQKWISMYPDGQEAWSEFRRTGYPKIFPVVVNDSGGTINTQTQIRRLPFPSTEYIDNAQNVTAAVSMLGGADNGGTKLWWDKK